MAHLLLCFLSLPLLTHSLTPTPPPPPPPTAQEFLDPHNQARAQVGVGPLRWSPVLADAASRITRYQRMKSNCQFADLSSGRTRYGANQLWARGSTVGPRQAVAAWVADKKYYNHVNNTCAPHHECGVYMQVVWRKSVELGCAQAMCVKDGSILTVCFYNPPGNIVGESPY